MQYNGMHCIVSISQKGKKVNEKMKRTIRKVVELLFELQETDPDSEMYFGIGRYHCNLRVQDGNGNIQWFSTSSIVEGDKPLEDAPEEIEKIINGVAS